MAASVDGRFRRALIFVHRWVGVALCLLFLLWFPSGIGMMYWDFPAVTVADRLERSPVLNPARIRLTPSEAFETLQGSQPPGQVRLDTFDGRPVYRFRTGRDETLVYADTGEPQFDVSKAMMDRVASAWTGQPASAARVDSVDEVDQWTIQSFAGLKPMWKYAWPDGQHVYVSELNGEVVQYTTTASRLGAYVGAIPHWLYFTPLRKHGPQWSRLVIWSSAIGTLTAILGLIIGLWMYSPSRRYRQAGMPTSIPYQGQKRWHTIFGLVFGLAAAAWAFSGMLSMDPFPARRIGGAPAARRGGGGVPQALRGRIQLAAFDARHPRDAVAQLVTLGVGVRELELVSFAGEPLYLATAGRGETRIVPLDADPRAAFDLQRIVDVVTRAAQPAGLAEIRVLEQYDRYYLDRRRERPLPVILARLNDAEQTRYYIDPKTAQIAGAYSPRNWTTRWLYHGLHSLDFPWLYEFRPLWDIVVIAFMLGGTALSVTSLILAWRVVGRTIGSR